MIGLGLAFASAALISVCDASHAPLDMNGKEVIMVGELVFNRHSAHVVEPGKPTPSSCAVFTVFPGTPGFLIPGVSEQEVSTEPRLREWSQKYKMYLDRHPEAPQKVRIRGILRVKGPVERNRSIDKGFGVKGAFRAALLVKDVEIVEALK